MNRVVFARDAVLGGHEKQWRNELCVVRGAPQWVLLADLLHAAGGVEYAAGRIADLIAATEAWVRETFPRESLHGTPARGLGVATREVASLAWEYGNLLTWARAFEDGMRHDTTRGLLPALAEQPEAERIRVLWENFKSRSILTDVRQQAALSLHVHAVHPPGQGARVKGDGRVRMSAPDPLTTRVNDRWELTFDRGRDVLTFATDLLQHVSAFVDAMLDVFEAWDDRIEAERQATSEEGR